MYLVKIETNGTHGNKNYKPFNVGPIRIPILPFLVDKSSKNNQISEALRLLSLT